MSTINWSYKTSDYPGYADIRNIRVCIYHFYPSVINANSNEYTLKIGAAPVMCLTKFSLENDIYKEEKTLQ